MRERKSLRSLMAFAGVALVAGASSVSYAQSSCTAGQTSVLFNFTGAAQNYVVPAGFSSAVVHLRGAQGGSGAVGGANVAGGTGGLGAQVSGTLALTTGQSLDIFVGGQGATPTGGFNGGANGGAQNAGGGGGASDIRVGGTAEANRVATAGGGGGGGRGGCDEGSAATGGTGGNGGAGGGGVGGNGIDSPTSGGVAGGGRGGNFGSVAGALGAAGIGCAGFLGAPGGTASTGTGAAGGAGQSCCCTTSNSIPGGGGGGGGQIGGGGGGGGSAGTTGCQGNSKGAGGGGGGGTSFSGGLTGTISSNDGVWLGNGVVELCLVPDSADLSVTKTDGVTSVIAGSSTTYTIVASNAGPNNVSSATVADTFPASLTCTWTCAGAGGGTCTASGSGNINDTVSLPVGGSVTYTAVCSVSTSATGSLANTATVTSSTADPTPANNSATDTNTILVPANGACGSANGVAVGIAPAANLCADASLPTVTSSVSQFTWTCNGANGGTNASCAAPRTYTVTPSVIGGNGTATGGGAVLHNNTGSVTITADPGFFPVTPIGGTCGGNLVGTAYTTLPVTADCTVEASFTAVLTPGMVISPPNGGTMSCLPQAAAGGPVSCTVLANGGFQMSSISGCGGSMTNATTYVTAPMTVPCVISVVFASTASTEVPVFSGAWAWLLAALAAAASGFALRRRNRASR